MANTDDFKGLGQDMANAYTDRVKAIKNIKADTKSLLNTCKEEDKARAADVSKLKADADKFVEELAGENKKLKADTQKLITNLIGESKERAAEVADLLADYKKERVATATAWKGLLSTMASTRKEKPSPIAITAGAEKKALVKTGKKTPAKGKGKKRRSKKR